MMIYFQKLKLVECQIIIKNSFFLLKSEIISLTVFYVYVKARLVKTGLNLFSGARLLCCQTPNQFVQLISRIIFTFV